MTDDDVFPPPPDPDAAAVPVDLTGYHLAWTAGRPVMLAFPDVGTMLMACFADAMRLHAFYARVGVTFDAVRQVRDGDRLVADAKGAGVRIMVNPRVEADRLLFEYILEDGES